MAITHDLKEFCRALEAEGIEADVSGRRTGHSRIVISVSRGGRTARMTISSSVSKGTHEFKNNVSKARRLLNG